MNKKRWLEIYKCRECWHCNEFKYWKGINSWDLDTETERVNRFVKVLPHKSFWACFSTHFWLIWLMWKWFSVWKRRKAHLYWVKGMRLGISRVSEAGGWSFSNRTFHSSSSPTVPTCDTQRMCLMWTVCCQLHPTLNIDTISKNKKMLRL